MKCRISLLRASINRAPAEGIIDAKGRACRGEKSEMVGSRRSTAFLKNHCSKDIEKKKLNAAGPHYRVLPSIARRQKASLMPIGGHAEVKRVKWSAPAAPELLLRVID